MTSTKQQNAERRAKEQLKGNLGQKEAQLQKEKDTELDQMGEKSGEVDKSRRSSG